MGIEARLVLAATVAAGGLVACGGDDSGDDGAVTPAETSTQAPSTPALIGGDAILIETRVTDARSHTVELLSGSVIGESAFCPGGTVSGSSEGATITTTFDCPGGSLDVEYRPRQMSLVQSSSWEVVSGTGTFEGLPGGGRMVAAFDGDDPDVGREVFTGTVGR